MSIATSNSQPALVEGGALRPATPAAPDLICWLWAAFPPRDGQLHVSRIAAGLGVSQTTIRRWIKQADQTELNHAGMVILKRRAILRGRGHYMWPEADPATLRRTVDQLRMAETTLQNITDRGPTQRQRSRGLDQPHDVHLVYYPAAHVYGLSSSRHVKTKPRLRHTGGEILDSITLPTEPSAVIAKAQILLQLEDARCIAPRTLVPRHRTETWLETTGPFQAQGSSQLNPDHNTHLRGSGLLHG